MSLKKIEQIKSNKLFKIWDIIIYAAVIALAAVLFISFYFTRERGELTGISILYDNTEIFTYDFEKDECTVLDDGHIMIVSNDSEGAALRFFVSAEDTQNDYNDIYIDKTAVSVTVTDADCSSHKDCYYMSDITDSSMEIYCTPHKLRITAIDYSPSGTDIIM